MSLQTKLLSSLLIILSALTIITIGYNYEEEKSFTERLIKNQTSHTVDQYFDSVNTLMITGAMENREVLREKLLARDEITEARVIRGPAVVNDLGEGFDHERPKDEYDQRALKGEHFSFIETTDKGRVLTVIRPYKASTNYRGTNCIECHVVKEGTVLGAVRVSYSLKDLDHRLQTSLKTSAKYMGAMSLTALLVMALALHFLIIKKIKMANKTMSEMANNYDLTKRLPFKGKDEMGALSLAFNHMVSELQNGMNSVSSSTKKILSGSIEISNLTKETTKDILEQQDETNKIASAMTEMSTTAKLVSDNSANAQNATSTASNEADLGVRNGENASSKINTLTNYITDVSETIHNLESEAKKISEAIENIYEITQKTQHLSINAAVEAARAGVHGKGFVVVAEEIGELASQTKVSTNQIQEVTATLNEVVEDAVKKMKQTNDLAIDGNEQVQLSTASISRISNEVQVVKEMNEHIATAAKEQSYASKEIDSNLQQIMDLSNKNSEAAKQMGSLGEDFSHMAKELEEEVSKFKL